MPDIEGQTIDTGEVDAVFASLKELADTKMPGFERHMVSDDLLRQIATAAVVASVQYRNAPSI